MSKRTPVPLYGEEDEEFEFLPFRFERLQDEKVLISNIVGEWALLDNEEFENFSLKKSPSPQIKDMLLARHFIRHKDQESPLRLLSLKLATRNRLIDSGTGLHIFVVTLRCDHACEYCQVSRQNSRSTEFDLSEADALAALDIVFASPNHDLKIEFQGGESLLNFELIKLIVLESLRKNEIYKKNLAFVIATNLSCLDDEMISFAGAHDIYFSTSLDGNRELHNANRSRPGRNSWELTIQGIEKIRNQLGHDRVSALMTTTFASLAQPRQIVDEYIRLGFSEIFLRFLSPYGHAIKTGSHAKYDNEKWLDFYFTGLDYIIELNRDGHQVTELMAATYLKKMLTNDPCTYVDLSTPTGAGIGALVYNYDGDIYISDEGRMLKEMKDEIFKLGSVRTHSYLDIMTSEVLLDAVEQSFAPSAPMCSDCALEPYCGSDPVLHHTLFGDFVGFKPESPFCERTMKIVPYLMNRYVQDEFCRDLFTRWASA